MMHLFNPNPSLRSASRTRPLAALSLLAALCIASPTAAQPPALQLQARSIPPGVEPEALRAAISAELNTDVTLVQTASAAHLEVESLGAHSARVAWRAPSASGVTRDVELPADPVQALDTLVLLCANLLRDEAAELLTDLQRARTPKPPAPPAPSGCDPWHAKHVFFGANLAPYVGSSSFHGTEVERAFSFNLFGGITGSVRGFELGGALNLTTHALCGVQLSAGANLVFGPASGAQIGLIDSAGGRLNGLQLGLVDIAGGAVTGAQVGLVNIGAADVSGLQLGLSNTSAADFSGAQIGLVNVSAGRVDGLQLGQANVATGAIDGAQIGLVNLAVDGGSGLQFGQLNIAAGGLSGSQLGLANISDGRVSGIMFGLLNVAEDADAAVGLVTLLARGRTQLDVWGTDTGLAMVGVEHGGSLVHNIYGLGVTHRDNLGVLGAAALGIGVRALDRPRVFIDVDAIGYALLGHDDKADRTVWSGFWQLRVPVGLRLSDDVALWVAPALSVSVADVGEPLTDPSLLGSTRLSRRDSSTVVRLWPGFSAGARFF